jgi:hypothetical protein
MRDRERQSDGQRQTRRQDTSKAKQRQDNTTQHNTTQHNTRDLKETDMFGTSRTLSGLGLIGVLQHRYTYAFVVVVDVNRCYLLLSCLALSCFDLNRVLSYRLALPSFHICTGY